MAGYSARARPGPRAHSRVRDALDAQNPYRAAPRFNDSRLRPGFQAESRRGVSRGVHDAHLDVAQLSDSRLARRRPASSRARRLRAGAEASRSRDGPARTDLDTCAVEEVFPLPEDGRPDPQGIPAFGHRG